MRIKFTTDYVTKEAKPQTFKKDQIVEFADDEAGQRSAQHFLSRNKAVEVTGQEKAAESASDESPVADMQVAEATEHIARMRSKEKLADIIANDKRVSVKKAAQDRLDALSKEETSGGTVQHMVPTEKR